MMHYADSSKTIPQIAAELGAAVVLEGAVQRAGDNVRVNVQLIDGVSDVHLWAENYDRELTTETIFAIQADIAHAVASALSVVLSPEESSACGRIRPAICRPTRPFCAANWSLAPQHCRRNARNRPLRNSIAPLSWIPTLPRPMHARPRSSW